MTVPAPGRLSTITGTPSARDISGASVRTTESSVLAPPGNGTITRTDSTSSTPNYFIDIRTLQNASGDADLILAANGEKVIMGGINEARLHERSNAYICGWQKAAYEPHRYIDAS